VAVDYVITLALSMRYSIREVLRCLREGVQWLLDPSVRLKVAGRSGISQASSRLGAAPPRRPYTGLVGPVAEKRTRTLIPSGCHRRSSMCPMPRFLPKRERACRNPSVTGGAFCWVR
jgi:hypothetical protein